VALNGDWRFLEDDPPGNAVSLLYDVRPDATGARAASQPCARAASEESSSLHGRWPGEIVATDNGDPSCFTPFQ
jgi:hypothetical protein